MTKLSRKIDIFFFLVQVLGVEYFILGLEHLERIEITIASQLYNVE